MKKMMKKMKKVTTKEDEKEQDDVNDGATLFIRNLSLDTERLALKKNLKSLEGLKEFILSETIKLENPVDLLLFNLRTNLLQRKFFSKHTVILIMNLMLNHIT